MPSQGLCLGSKKTKANPPPDHCLGVQLAVKPMLTVSLSLAMYIAHRSQDEMRRAVDMFVGKLEVAAEMDIQAHNEFKPAIHKLQILPEVEQVQSRMH